MLHLRHVRLRLTAALLTAGVVSSAVFASASTLGGLQTDAFGAATGGTRHVTSVQLEWNRDARFSTRPESVRLSTNDGQVFDAGDTVDVTAVGADSDMCSASTTVAKRAAVVDVAFPACGVMVWELSGVAVSISGGATTTSLRSNLGALHSSLASFDGLVVQPDAPATPGYTTIAQGGAETLATLSLEVGEATEEQLVGRRLLSVLHTAQNEPITYAGTVGTAASNEGVWVETDPKSAQPVVVADILRLAGGRAPGVTDAVRYRMVLLQPQRLGAGQALTNQYALTTAAGTIESTGGGGEVVDVSSAVEPVGLDSRLTVKGKYGQQQDDISLRFCYQFDIKNVSDEPVEWQVAFDTTQPPMWGLNPGIVKEGAVGTLHSKWSFETLSHNQASGLWTVGGVSWNKVLAPKASTTVGYCAQPKVPVLDTTRFEKPEISLKSGNKSDYVEFRVKVKSSFDYLVPWEAEVDLADYVCPASLPATLSGQNSVLTRIEGSRYRVTGTDNTYRFVSAKKKQDFVFLGFNPVSDPFAPGCS